MYTLAPFDDKETSTPPGRGIMHRNIAEMPKPTRKEINNPVKELSRKIDLILPTTCIESTPKTMNEMIPTTKEPMSLPQIDFILPSPPLTPESQRPALIPTPESQQRLVIIPTQIIVEDCDDKDNVRLLTDDCLVDDYLTNFSRMKTNQLSRQQQHNGKKRCHTLTAPPLKLSKIETAVEMTDERSGLLDPTKSTDTSSVKSETSTSDSKTFLVLASRLGKVYVYRFNKAKSLFTFGPLNPVRKLIIYLITNQIFEFFVILTILVNCVFLAIEDAPEESEYVFTAIYTSEMLLKIIAKGFAFHSFAYLRDPWNWLDFIVVILGYITLLPGVANFSGIRTFRVLRALRTISAIEGLKTMVNALLKSMRMLSDVLILTSFFICVFALVGLQLFSGIYHNRCVSNTIQFNSSESWLAEVQNRDNWYRKIQICGNNTGSLQCPSNYTCQKHAGPNPNYGYTSYDDFGWAILISFQLVTLDYWENVYLHTASALGPWYIFYFMLVIFFGSFYLINLVLAVVAVSYQQETAHNSDLESQYEYLREVASSYSLHQRILPKVIFDENTIDLVGSLPCVQSGPSVIILSRNGAGKQSSTGLNRNTAPRQRKMTNTSEERKSLDIAAKEKLNSIINRVNMDRARNGETGERSARISKINIENCRSVGKKLHLPISSSTESTNSKLSTGRTVDKKSTLRYVKNQLAVESQSHLPVPYANAEQSSLRILQRLRVSFYWIVVNPWFELAVTGCILLNTICLALESHGMDPNLKKALDIGNHVFTTIFISEMALKLVAFTPRGYIKSKWNIFDGMVVILSILDLIVEVSTTTSNGDLTIIRSLRLFRVLKLAQSWSTMRLLLSAIGRSLTALGNLTLILGIIVYIFAVIGTKVFGEHYVAEKFPTGKVPTWNFSNFQHSIMVIFRVLCGEWIEVLYDAMKVSGLWAIAFFMPALIVGNFLVLNLFLALLLSSFADQAMEEELKRKSFIKSKLKWVSSTRKLASIQSMFKARRATPNNTNPPSLESSGTGSFIKTVALLSESKSSMKKVSSFDSVSQTGSKSRKPSDVGMPTAETTAAVAGKPRCPSPPTAKFCCEWLREPGKTGVRKRVKDFIEHKWFENVVLFMIIASSVILVFEDIHLSTKPKLQQALNILNIIFCVLFFVEMLLKLVGLGLCKYVRNPWNCLDALIVAVSIASVINGFTNTSTNLKTLRSLRTLRALRPLRAVSRWDGMRIVVNSLLKAIPSIGNVLLVCLMFWLIFSILGVQFFGGKFYKCVDRNFTRISADVIRNKSECLGAGFQWRNSNVNFDNAFNGFLPLFQVATFEGWIEVMRDAVDATGIDQQPRTGNNFLAYSYFVIFIIIGSFFILNLFISVIIDNFYRLKKQYDDCGTIEVFLTTEQKNWFSTVKKALTKKPKKVIHRPHGYYHSRIFDAITSPKFETCTMLLIFTNIVLMMVQHYEQSADITRMLYCVNLVFTVLFTVELALRIVALRHQYFLDAWNIFDLLIVILSIIGIVLEYMNVFLSVTPSVLRVARVLRIGRLLRYFNSAKGIRRLLVALVFSLPALFNIGALLFLIIFIYSIIGMSNFGYVRKQGTLNTVVNFETFGNSMLVLFRLSTSAGWNEVLNALMVQPPDCDPNYRGIPNGNCGTPWVAVVYLTSFILITFLIVVNMYIAVILENFNQAHEQEEIGVTDEDIEMFYAVWQLYDPTATQYIEFEKLPYLVANLGAPLGIPFPNRVAVHNLNLPMIEGDKIHCVDVLQALLKRVLGTLTDTNTENLVNMRKTIDRKLKTAFPSRLKDTTKTTTMERFQEAKAAAIIQKHFRDWKRRVEERTREGGEAGRKTSDGKRKDKHSRKSGSLNRFLTEGKLLSRSRSFLAKSPFAKRHFFKSSNVDSMDCVKSCPMVEQVERPVSARPQRKFGSEVLTRSNSVRSAPPAPQKSFSDCNLKSTASLRFASFDKPIGSARSITSTATDCSDQQSSDGFLSVKSAYRMSPVVYSNSRSPSPEQTPYNVHREIHTKETDDVFCNIDDTLCQTPSIALEVPKLQVGDTTNTASLLFEPPNDKTRAVVLANRSCHSASDFPLLPECKVAKPTNTESTKSRSQSYPASITNVVQPRPTVDLQKESFSNGAIFKSRLQNGSQPSKCNGEHLSVHSIPPLTSRESKNLAMKRNGDVVACCSLKLEMFSSVVSVTGVPTPSGVISCDAPVEINNNNIV